MNRKQHWEKIYQKKSHREVSWYQRKATLSLQLIKDCSLTADAAIIDVGSGVSCLAEDLLDLGYENISVLDISTAALAINRKSLGNRAERIQWLEADVCSFTAPQQYRLWHDRAVFHFLTEPLDREHYITSMRNSLAPEAFAIIACFSFNGPRKCSGLDIVQYDSQSLSATLGKGFTLIKSLEETHITPDGKEQAFQYSHFRKSTE